MYFTQRTTGVYTSDTLCTCPVQFCSLLCVFERDDFLFGLQFSTHEEGSLGGNPTYQSTSRANCTSALD